MCPAELRSTAVHVETAERRAEGCGSRSPRSEQGECSGQGPGRQVHRRQKTTAAATHSRVTTG